MIRVSLTDYELRLAAHAGVERQLEALRLGRQDNHGFAGAGWDLHIEGACAEVAVAKATGRYWDAVVRRPEDLAGDVGRGLQVRSTRRSNGCLIIHPTDPDEAAFVLVVAAPPAFNIIGWIRGREAKRDEWWREDTGRPAFFVPQGGLTDVQPKAQPQAPR